MHEGSLWCFWSGRAVILETCSQIQANPSKSVLSNWTEGLNFILETFYIDASAKLVVLNVDLVKVQSCYRYHHFGRPVACLKVGLSTVRSVPGMLSTRSKCSLDGMPVCYRSPCIHTSYLEAI